MCSLFLCLKKSLTEYRRFLSPSADSELKSNPLVSSGESENAIAVGAKPEKFDSSSQFVRQINNKNDDKIIKGLIFLSSFTTFL